MDRNEISKAAENVIYYIPSRVFAGMAGENGTSKTFQKYGRAALYSRELARMPSGLSCAKPTHHQETYKLHIKSMPEGQFLFEKRKFYILIYIQRRDYILIYIVQLAEDSLLT